jgi:hypothetical protein
MRRVNFDLGIVCPCHARHTFAGSNLFIIIIINQPQNRRSDDRRSQSRYY